MTLRRRWHRRYLRLAALNGYKASIFPICPFCGKETAPTEICYEWNTDAVTAQTGCFNEECPGCKGKVRFLVRIRPEDEEKAVGDFLGKENLFFKGIKAAKKAELICGECGGKYTYKITKAAKGKVLHGFGCGNPRCRSLGLLKWILLTAADIEKIERRKPKEQRCPICGEALQGSRVICKYRGGEICEAHCLSCEWRESTTSLGHCVHPNVIEKSRKR